MVDVANSTYAGWRATSPNDIDKWMEAYHSCVEQIDTYREKRRSGENESRHVVVDVEGSGSSG